MSRIRWAPARAVLPEQLNSAATPGMFARLRAGAIPISAVVSRGSLLGRMPSANIGYVGFAFKDEDEALHAMNAPLINYVRNEAARRECTSCRPSGTTADYISTSTHPINGPGRSKRIEAARRAHPVLVDMFKTLGASPVPLAFPEVYTSLPTKIVEVVKPAACHVRDVTILRGSKLSA